ncbi:MAG: UDP-galactopyranose mutase [Actinomycetota bacterium]|nr:UDP-galactopyranose mutase [Actinomycetota bacterium]
MSGSYDLVCVSHLRWAFVFQRPQHLLTRAARDRRVFYLEEATFGDGDWEPLASGQPRLDLFGEWRGVTVATPRLPDGTSTPVAEAMQRTLLDELFVEHEIDDYVLWLYTPMAVAWTRHLKPLTTVYDCMDELSLFAGAPPELGLREEELFERADLVFTGGQSLYEAKRRRHRSVHLFPSSVDAAHFARARKALPDPSDQASIAHPRLGFYGVIDERMDFELLSGVARARPSWEIAVVGPSVPKFDSEALAREPNIHYLGGKPYEELPAYLASWDVALLPFALNEATRFVSPTKIPEYLAAGKPVVSTPVTDVVRPYGDLGLVRIARTVDEFVAACEGALAEPKGDRLDRVDALLAEQSWDQTWKRMAELVDLVVSAPAAPARRRIKRFDYLVVGAGFAGSVLAERLAAGAGMDVLVVDRRPHIGGNAYDHYDEAGILVHRYGPHIFHTNSARVFEYLSRFTEWRPYEHRVRAHVGGKLLPIPINLDTVNGLYGLDLRSDELEHFFASRAEPVERARTSEDVVVGTVGRELYETFFRGYTRKQWGLDPSELDASVTARVPTRTNRDDRYFLDEFQAMPLHGFTRMFERMLEHPRIKILLGTEYREIERLIPYRRMIYTGPVDEFFNYCYGKLPYRSLEFRHETHDVPAFQPAPVVNYPNDHEHTRITEFKYLTGQEHSKTSIVYEFPRAEGDPYYPIPRPENGVLYKQYKELADATAEVEFVGRLATYKYYNMDQVVAQALAVYDRIAGKRSDEEPRDGISGPLQAAARALGGAGVHGESGRGRVLRSARPDRP